MKVITAVKLEQTLRCAPQKWFWSFHLVLLKAAQEKKNRWRVSLHMWGVCIMKGNVLSAVYFNKTNDNTGK